MGVRQASGSLARWLQLRSPGLRSRSIGALLFIVQRFVFTKAIASYGLRLIGRSDEVSKRPSREDVSDLIQNSPRDVVVTLLLMAPPAKLSNVEIKPVFSLVGDRLWSERASRGLIAWAQAQPATAIESCAIWLANPSGLNAHQLRIALRLISEHASMMSQALARFIFDSIKPTALKRPDPYSFNGILPAQEAVAALLAEWPELSREWIKEELPAPEAARRRRILTQSFALNRELTVREHLGPMMLAVWSDSDAALSALKNIDNKYSVSDQYGDSKRKAYRPWPTLPIAFPPAFGVLLTALIVTLASRVPLSLSRTAPSVLDALLPLLGIIAAVHLLAIEIASGRLPRLATITVVTSPRILFAYGFLISSVAFSYAGTWLWSFDPSEERVWVVLTLLLSFAALAMVIYDLVQAQDTRAVARVLARRNHRHAKRAAIEFGDILQESQEWEKTLSHLRNIRSAIGPPVARRHSIVSAKHGGIVRVNLRHAERADAQVDEAFENPTHQSLHKTEILLFKKPGTSVSRGEPLAAVVTDEPRLARRLEEEIGGAITVDAAPASAKAVDAVVAVSRILGKTIEESEQEASRDIAGYIRDMLEVGLSNIQTNRAGNQKNPAPFAPTVAAALAFDRIYREFLSENDGTKQEIAGRVLLLLAHLSVYYPASQILEALMLRLGMLASDVSHDKVSSVISTWADLGKISFLTDNRPMRRLVVKDMGDLCSKLAGDCEASETAGFSIDRYAEMLAAAMYADYFASEEVMSGAEVIADIAKQSSQSVPRFTAAICLLEIGAAALEHGRYSIAYRMVATIKDAGIDLPRMVEAMHRPEIASRMQMKNSLAGEAFGVDVEASVMRFQSWVESLTIVPG